MQDLFYKGVLYCGRQDCSDMHSWGPGVRSLYVLHYVVKGRGYFEVNKKRYRIEKGQSFLIRPFEKIHYYPEKSDPWEYVWLDFDIPAFNSIVNSIPFERGGCVTKTIDSSDLLPLFEELLRRFSYNNTPLSCYGIAYAILTTYFDKNGGDNIIEAGDEKFLCALRIIKENYHLSAFDSRFLCEQLSLSRSTLHRLFTKNTGMSPNRFLTEYRINKACEMLGFDVSVKSIAHSCGFSDAYYFSNVFKRVKGVSPSGYRQT